MNYKSADGLKSMYEGALIEGSKSSVFQLVQNVKLNY